MLTLAAPRFATSSSSRRVAIVGSRLTRLDLLRAHPGVVESARSAVSMYVQTLPPGTQVISGGAVGVDTFAHDAAYERYLKGELPRPIVCRVPIPICHRTGKPLQLSRGEFARLAKGRNQRIVNLLEGEEDCLVAFWDGVSHGTKDVIERAEKVGKLRCILRLVGGPLVEFLP